MIATCKRLPVDIFLTDSLSKSLAFCEFASVNFEPCFMVYYYLYGVFLSLKSIIFLVSFNLMVILSMFKITQNTVTVLL